MGLFYLCRGTSIHTRHLTTFQKVQENYYHWWDVTITAYVLESLRQHLILTANEDEVKREIRQFRENMNLAHDEIVNTDIIRFKSAGLYNWLYRDLVNKLKYIYTYGQVSGLINSIEACVFVAIDAICFVDGFCDDIERYNIYAGNVALAMSIRCDDPVIKKHDLKLKFFAVTHIQRQWREAISNPRYLLCRNRLQREFDTLVI